jgi:hypothetical protein
MHRSGNPTRFRPLAVPAVLLLTALVAAGCSKTDGRVEVQGRVTYNGKRVMNGDIRFFPAAGTTGRATGAPIVDGQYVIDRNGGVPLGEHRVKVRAFILEGVGPIGGSGGATDIRGGSSQPASGQSGNLPTYRADGRQNYLPPRFNDQTELVHRVTGESNPQTIDLDLTE